MRGEREKNGRKQNPFNVIFKFKSTGKLEFFDKQQIVADGEKAKTLLFEDFSKKNFKFAVVDEMYYYAGFDSQSSVYKLVTDNVNVYSGDIKIASGTIEQLKKDGVFKTNSMSCCMRLVIVTEGGRLGYLDLSAMGREAFFTFKNTLGKGVEFDFIIAGTSVETYEVKAPNSEKKITKTAIVPVFESWIPDASSKVAQTIDGILAEWKKYLAGEKSELLPNEDTAAPAPAPAAQPAETPAAAPAETPAQSKAAKAKAAAATKATPPDVAAMPKADEASDTGGGADGDSITEDLPF